MDGRTGIRDRPIVVFVYMMAIIGRPYIPLGGGFGTPPVGWVQIVNEKNLKYCGKLKTYCGKLKTYCGKLKDIL